MHTRRTALCCLLTLTVAASRACGEGSSFTYPAGKISPAGELRYINKLPVLVVAGTPEEMGSAVGTLALKPGERVLGYPRELLRLRRAGLFWGYFLASGRRLYQRFPGEYQDELEAIARAAKVDRDLVIAGNTFFDLKKIFACSAVVVAKERSATGGPLLARNLDYPSLGYIHEYSLVTVYRPKGKLAFASVGFPGLVGVLSGMNEAGVALGVLESFDVKGGEPRFDDKGVPYGLCLRRVLEEARTIDEAKKVLEKQRRTTIINVAIADRDSVAVLEVSPRQVVRRDPARGACVCTNHFCTPLLKARNPANIERTFERFGRLEAVTEKEGKLTPDDLRKHLDAVNLGTLTLQTMAFEPAMLRLHLGIGDVPSSRLPMQTLDLAELLRGGPDRR